MCRMLGSRMLWIASLALMAVAASVLSAGELSNRRAPGFSLPDASFKQYDLADFRGKVVIVNIMRTACVHCAAFSKVLSQAAKKYGDGVKVLSIVNPPDNQRTVQAYQTKNGVSTTILFDCSQVAASYLKLTPQNPSFDVPHFFIVDGQGMIRDDYGYTEANKDIFEGTALFKILEKYVPKPALAMAR